MKKINIILLLAIAWMGESKAQSCRLQDSLGLVALYGATDGVRWSPIRWDLTQPITSWSGVTTNANGCVTNIDLPRNGLNGDVSLFGNGSMLFLENVRLNGNQLQGALPNIDVTRFPSLLSVDLSNNRFTGAIPNYNLPFLTGLHLNGNQLTGSIPNFNNLPALMMAYLNDNQLTGSIPSFNLPQLRILDLRRNFLNGNIPNFDLPQLTFISLEANQLTGDIPNFNRLPNLKDVQLDYNQLSGNIPDFRFLNLNTLALHVNQLTGSIPNFNFPNLQYLLLGVNQLTGSIPNFNFPLLQRLDLQQNQLTGTIPNFNYPNLQMITIDNNKFTFEHLLPNFLSLNAPALKRYAPQNPIFVDTTLVKQLGQSLNVPLGVDMAVATNVYRWYKNGVLLPNQNTNSLIFNSLGFSDAGIYTSQVTNPQLSQLTLSSRNIAVQVNCNPIQATQQLALCAGQSVRLPTGRLVNAIGTYQDILPSVLEPTCDSIRYTTIVSNDNSCHCTDSLALVDLYNATTGALWTNKTNWLTANPIHTWYGVRLNGQGCVDSLKLGEDSLRGQIPPSLGNLSQMRYLALHANRLTGTIPDHLGNLSSMEHFYLFNNQLTGSIPQTVKNLRNLQFLYLGQNQLTGNIPDSLEKLPRLVVIHLSNNQLTGNIPTNLGNFPFSWNLTELWLRNNQLSGSIPASLGNLTNLQYLLLEGNQLTGNIPSNVAAINTFLYVGLSRNRLTGSIPLFSAPSLLQLGLNDNQLTGVIPNFNLPNLTQLSLYNNQLTGAIPNFNLPNLQNLYLHNNQLSGNIPDFQNLTSLSVFWCRSNQISGIPNLVYSVNLRSFRVDTNRLTFKDILPNLSRGITYIKQDSIFPSRTYRQNAGSTVSIQLGIDGALSSNIYQWYKNGNPYQTNSVNYLNINTLSVQDAGVYKCAVTNPNAPNLTLWTGNAAVQIICPPITVNRLQVAICEDTFYTLPSGRTVNWQGVYLDTVRGWLGCDSILTELNLRMNSFRQVVRFMGTRSICQGDSVLIHNQWIRTAGISEYYDTTNCLIAHYIVSINVIPRLSISTMVLQQPGSCSLNGRVQVNLLGGISGYDYRILWSNGQNTSTITNLTGGTYRVTVMGDSVCRQVLTDSVTLQTTQPLSATMTSTPVSCYGRNDGMATVTVSEGLPPYSYAWSNGSSTASISNLLPNTYIVTITDAQGCPLVKTVLITQPNELRRTLDTTLCQGSNFRNHTTAGIFIDTLPSVSGCDTILTTTLRLIPRLRISIDTLQQPISCRNNGSLRVNLWGGVTGYPYNILWSNGYIHPTIENLVGGTYTVTVTDNTVCNQRLTATVTLLTPTRLDASMTHTNVSCYGRNDGFAQLTVSNGSRPYTYQWSNGQTDSFVTHLVPNTYIVTIADAQGCTLVKTVRITQPNELRRTIDTTLCQGSNFRNHTTAGIFIDTLPSVGGCDTILTTTLRLIPRLRISIDTLQQPISCRNNGSLRVNLWGGVAGYPYNILWSNGSIHPTIENLVGGRYTVTVTDNTVCNQQWTESVTLLTPTRLDASMTHTNVSCWGRNDGFAQLTVSNGSRPYRYQWSNGQTDSFATQLLSNTYLITITDAQGCNLVKTVFITQPSELRKRVDTTICQGASFMNHTTTGTFIDTLRFVNACDTILTTRLTVIPVRRDSVQTTICEGQSITINNQVITQAGFYSETIRSLQGCDSVIRVTQLSLLSRLRKDSLVVTPTTSCNNTGTAEIYLRSNGFPYNILWSNGQSTHRITGLPRGTYYVTVIGNSICRDTLRDTVRITQPTPLQITLTPQHINCYNTATGSITVQPSKGVAPYTYRWSNNETDTIINGLLSGYYRVTVTDAQACTAVGEVTLLQPTYRLPTEHSVTICQGDSIRIGNHLYRISGDFTDTLHTNLGCDSIVITHLTVIRRLNISIEILDDPISCDPSGILRVNLLGGERNLNYPILWSTRSSNTTNTIEKLGQGTYWVTVIDNSVCRDTLRDSVRLTKRDSLIVSLTKTDVRCYNQSNGSVTTRVSGASPFRYVWSNDSTTSSINNLDTGSYRLIVTDNVGCSDTQMVTITQPNEIRRTINATICEGATYALCDGRTVNTSGTYVCSKSNSTGCDSIIVTDLTVYPTVVYPKDSVRCGVVRDNPNPLIETSYLYPQRCTTKVIKSIYTSYEKTQIVWVCDTKDTGKIYTPFKTYKGCDSVFIVHKKLAAKLPRIVEIVEITTRKDTGLSFKGTRFVDNLNSCEDSFWLKKLATKSITVPKCNRRPGIDTLIRLDTINGNFIKQDIMFLTNYTFDTCGCFKVDTIYNRLITNDSDTLNNYLFMNNYELYPPLELLVVDKRGVLLYQSPPDAPFKNDWDGKGQDGNQLPEGIYNYILRIRHNRIQCVRQGVLDIKYID